MTDLLIGLPALLPLALTAVNHGTWRPPTGAEGAPGVGAISALVPARDEAANIGPCVRALLAAGVDEVLVYDDGSTDGTGAIVAALAAGDPRVRVFRGEGPPPGWLGKAHACHRLAGHARGDVLLFVDADVRVEPALRAGLATALRGVDVATGVPRQITGTLGEQLVVPLLHLTYTSWLPLALIPVVRAPSVLAANGQLLAVRRLAYARSGGFAAVRGEVVDDMAFCRRLKALGHRVRFVDAQALASCRMYRSTAEVVDGFSKNLYAGIGGTPPALVAVLALYAACFLLPWVALPFAPLPALLGIGANLVQRAMLAERHGHPATAVLLHPVGVALLLGIAVRSAWWSWTGRTRWRGRLVTAGVPERASLVGEVGA